MQEQMDTDWWWRSDIAALGDYCLAGLVRQHGLWGSGSLEDGLNVLAGATRSGAGVGRHWVWLADWQSRNHWEWMGRVTEHANQFL